MQLIHTFIKADKIQCVCVCVCVCRIMGLVLRLCCGCRGQSAPWRPRLLTAAQLCVCLSVCVCVCVCVCVQQLRRTWRAALCLLSAGLSLLVLHIVLTVQMSLRLSPQPRSEHVLAAAATSPSSSLTSDFISIQPQRSGLQGPGFSLAGFDFFLPPSIVNNNKHRHWVDGNK